jgi:hypothetical protein
MMLSMARQPKRPPDPNQLAHLIMALSTGEMSELQTDDGKNAAAVALGRMGGLKGGKARAEKLTARRRTEIAAGAAAARWKRK